MLCILSACTWANVTRSCRATQEQVGSLAASSRRENGSTRAPCSLSSGHCAADCASWAAQGGDERDLTRKGPRGLSDNGHRPPASEF